MTKSRSSAPASGSRSSLLRLAIGGVVIGGLVIAAYLIGRRTGGPEGPKSTGLAVVAAPTVNLPPGFAVGHSLGRPDAPLVLEVWTDFQCPACRDFALSMEPALRATYIQPGTLRFEHHDFAFLGEESKVMAVAARCAERQDSFWPYYDLLYANQPTPENSGVFTPDRAVELATSLNLDISAFRPCLADASLLEAVGLETSQAYVRKIPETPWAVLNGVDIPSAGNWDVLKAAIDGALASRPTSTETNIPAAR